MTDHSVEQVAINRTVNRQWDFHAWMTLHFNWLALTLEGESLCIELQLIIVNREKQLRFIVWISLHKSKENQLIWMQPFSLDINNHKINFKVTDIKSVKHHNIYSTLWTI